jgi:hypothetical protein
MKFTIKRKQDADALFTKGRSKARILTTQAKGYSGKKINLKKFYFKINEKMKMLKRTRMPRTPHNTTQYLTSNFSENRNSSIFNVISDYTKHAITDLLLDEVLSVDDLCVTGGSMKGIINTNILELFPIRNPDDETNSSTELLETNDSDITYHQIQEFNKGKSVEILENMEINIQKENVNSNVWKFK